MKPYQDAISTENMLYTTGQIAVNEKGERVGDEIFEQTIKTLENLEAVIESKGFKKHHIVSLTIYLNDILHDFTDFNKAYITFFENCKPARTTIGATLFNPEFKVEIQAICNAGIDNRV